MRTVTYGAACSLDGFIAAPDGDADWIRGGPKANAYLRDYWSNVDTVLLGRKTYEFAQSMGMGGSMPGIEASYVFSRTLSFVTGKKTQLISSSASDFVRQLKAQPGKGICLFGGGVLAQSLIESGAVDEIAVNVQPVLLGGGTPMFANANARVNLDLIESRAMDDGALLAIYRPVFS